VPETERNLNKVSMIISSNMRSVAIRTSFMEIAFSQCQTGTTQTCLDLCPLEVLLLRYVSPHLVEESLTVPTPTGRPPSEEASSTDGHRMRCLRGDRLIEMDHQKVGAFVTARH
jgi:hypothetical protein